MNHYAGGENAADSRVLVWLAHEFPDRPITHDTRLQDDLGIDSLGWMDVTASIRSLCGVEIRDDALVATGTVGDLIQLIKAAEPADPQRPRPSPIEQPEQALGNARHFWLDPLTALELAGGYCIFALVWLLARCYFRYRVAGREHLPREGNFVLAPHHTSYLDCFALSAALRFSEMKRSYWAAFTGVGFSPLFRVLRRLTHVVPVDTARGAVEGLAYGASVLKAGHHLIWFPEGRISTTGEVQPLRPGIGLLLERYPAPVILVRLEGTRQALPRGNRIPRSGPIEVTFSRPFTVDELDRNGTGTSRAERIVDSLQREMRKFIPPPA